MRKPVGDAFLFYFERWRGSRRVQRMSFAERGIFLEMLIEEWIKGELPDNPVLVSQAIAISESQMAEVEAAWSTIRNHYVGMDRRPGFIQNLPLERVRRARCVQLRQQQKSGRNGGLTAAKRRRQRKAAVEDKPIATLQRPYSDPIVNETKRNEVRNETNTKELVVVPQKTTSTSGYQRFTAVYPKPSGPKAWETWQAIDPSAGTVDQIVAGAEAYAAHVRDWDSQFIKAPHNWLNGRGWLEPYAVKAATSIEADAKKIAERLKAEGIE